MAKKITDETLQFNIVVNGNKAQKEYNELQKKQKKLLNSTKDLEAEARKLKKANKQNSEEFKNLERQIIENNKAIDINERKMSELTQEIGLTNLTMKQLNSEARKLNTILSNLDPETDEWKQYNKQLAAVNNRQFELRKETRETAKALGGQTSKLKKFGAELKKIFFPVTGAVLFTDALKSMGRFAKQFILDAIELSEESRGIQVAFKALGEEGSEAFRKVKLSTRGLLSDLEIKKSLVEFDNFNISLEETDTLFEFLSLRATQTGGSVDKLKSSLVEGLSKESKLRIDNLGISTSVLNDELKRTPNFVQAVANIAKKEIVKAGDVLDKAASSSQKWNATLENAKVRLGNIIQISGAVPFFQRLGAGILESVLPLKSLTEEIVKEQTELNVLVTKLTNVNSGEEERKRLIEQIKEQYPDFNRMIDIEKATTEELSAALIKVNENYVNKIILQRKSEEIDKKANLVATDQIAFRENQKRALEILIKAEKEFGITSDASIPVLERRKKALEEGYKQQGFFKTSINGLVRDLQIFASEDFLEGKESEFLSNRKSQLSELVSEFEKLKSELDLTGTNNTKPKPITPTGNTDLTDEQKKAREQALADLKRYEEQKLQLINEAAIRAEKDEFERRILKIQQDAKSRETEINNLKISSSKKRELLALEAKKEQEQIDVVNADKEEKELLRIQQFEDRKRELENNIRLANTNSEEERELLKQELDLEKQLLHLDKIKLEETEKETLRQLIIENSELAIADIKEKYRLKEEKDLADFKNKQLKTETAFQQAKERLLNSGVNVLRNIFGQETAIGKALFYFQKGKAIADIVKETALANAKIVSATTAANAIAVSASPLTGGQPWVGINSANAAKNKVTNSVNAAAQIAAIAGTAIQGFEDGLYPVTRAQDGKKFSASFGGQPSTQIVGSPKTFLAGEMPEMIIDPTTFKKMDPNITDYILQLAGKRPLQGFESGKFPTPRDTTEATVNTNSTPMFSDEVGQEIIDNLKNLKATVVYTIQDELNRRDIEEKLKAVEQQSVN